MMNWLASVGTNFNNIQTLHQVALISGPFDNAHQGPGHHAPHWKPLSRFLSNRSRHRTHGDQVLINYGTSEEAIVRSHFVCRTLWRTIG
ncbi:hypothetical protein AVEN_253614-1 [Araneus ventricosus]|uniref:Uncharacterized protein n=1 Tax=Araneus ventricosus TaxID=182803 RepID=A0A4Y2CB48_ARAVE|nr:hypothetical protein AVEN_253614-1 [Araneus ventricosus]